uniref:Uncharacterized protein n=1 Tax=Anguilla anguilla TaxID=7936 RepID=A0A0E9Q5V9_ANGAN
MEDGYGKIWWKTNANFNEGSSYLI